MKSLALATVLALTALVHPVAAKDVWTQINESAPRSVFDQLNETAPRSVFDQLNDAAPLAPIFETLRDNAP